MADPEPSPAEIALQIAANPALRARFFKNPGAMIAKAVPAERLFGLGVGRDTKRLRQQVLAEVSVALAKKPETASSACDPFPTTLNLDEDNDGWANRIDNCPLVPNGGEVLGVPSPFNDGDPQIQFDEDIAPITPVPDGGLPRGPDRRPLRAGLRRRQLR